MKTFAGWKDALCVVNPETVIRWHRAGFRMFWRYKSRRKHGRPAVSPEMRRLIRMSHNPIERTASPHAPHGVRRKLLPSSPDPQQFESQPTTCRSVSCETATFARRCDRVRTNSRRTLSQLPGESCLIYPLNRLCSYSPELIRRVFGHACTTADRPNLPLPTVQLPQPRQLRLRTSENST